MTESLSKFKWEKQYRFLILIFLWNNHFPLVTLLFFALSDFLCAEESAFFMIYL